MIFDLRFRILDLELRAPHHLRHGIARQRHGVRQSSAAFPTPPLDSQTARRLPHWRHLLPCMFLRSLRVSAVSRSLSSVPTSSAAREPSRFAAATSATRFPVSPPAPAVIRNAANRDGSRAAAGPLAASPSRCLHNPVRGGTFVALAHPAVRSPLPATKEWGEGQPALHSFRAKEWGEGFLSANNMAFGCSQKAAPLPNPLPTAWSEGIVTRARGVPHSAIPNRNAKLETISL